MGTRETGAHLGWVAEDARLDSIREALHTPAPRLPDPDEFATPEGFEAAWQSWQLEMLDRAEVVLDRIRALVEGHQELSGAWVAGDLMALTMLRSAVAAEGSKPVAERAFGDAELAGTSRLLERFDPEVFVPPIAETGSSYSGRASLAHISLPVGEYRARDAVTGEEYRLLVGPVADRLGSTASAAIPQRDGDGEALDSIAAILRTSGARLGTVERVRGIVEGTGREASTHEPTTRVAEVLAFRQRTLNTPRPIAEDRAPVTSPEPPSV